jgi:predicted transcriptional regulator
MESSIARLDSKASTSNRPQATADPSPPEKAHIDRRSRIETLFDILRAIDGGYEKPTHIMYRANLSWTVMQDCISSLVKKGLITDASDNGKKRYRLTEKGKRSIEEYQSIRKNLDLISNTDE